VQLPVELKKNLNIYCFKIFYICLSCQGWQIHLTKTLKEDNCIESHKKTVKHLLFWYLYVLGSVSYNKNN